MNNNDYLVLIVVLAFAVFMVISTKICDKGEEDDK